MTQEEYLKKKDEQKAIYLQKVFSHGADDEEQLMKESLEEFELKYPPYKE